MARQHYRSAVNNLEVVEGAIAREDPELELTDVLLIVLSHSVLAVVDSLDNIARRVSDG